MEKRKKGLKRKFIRFTEWILLFAFAVFCIFPLLLTLADSFMSVNEIEERYGMVFGLNEAGVHSYISEHISISLIPKEASLQQYINIFLGNSGYLQKLWNTLIYTLPIAAGQVLFAAMAAYGICLMKGKRRYLIILGYIIIILMPYQVTLFPNYMMIEKLGLLNTRWSIWLLGIFSPFCVYFMERQMRRIPTELVEAAKLDGAGTIKIFLKLYLPMCKSVIYSCFLLVFADCFSMVEQPIWLLEDDKLQPLSVFLSSMNENAVPMVFAASMIFMIPNLLVFLYGESDLEEGLS